VGGPPHNICKPRRQRTRITYIETRKEKDGRIKIRLSKVGKDSKKDLQT